MGSSGVMKRSTPAFHNRVGFLISFPRLGRVMKRGNRDFFDVLLKLPMQTSVW